MTTKRINYDGEEVEHEDLTGKECLKQWLKYSNKYNCKTNVIVCVGEVIMSVSFSKNKLLELLKDKLDATRFKNCETSTRFRLSIMSLYGRTARISIIGSTFQDFEKTKENNWLQPIEVIEGVEWVGCDYCNPTQTCTCPECGQEPVVMGA